LAPPNVASRTAIATREDFAADIFIYAAFIRVSGKGFDTPGSGCLRWLKQSHGQDC
jgi:hypothetical protein